VGLSQQEHQAARTVFARRATRQRVKAKRIDDIFAERYVEKEKEEVEGCGLRFEIAVSQ